MASLIHFGVMFHYNVHFNAKPNIVRVVQSSALINHTYEYLSCVIHLSLYQNSNPDHLFACWSFGPQICFDKRITTTEMRDRAYAGGEHWDMFLHKRAPAGTRLKTWAAAQDSAVFEREPAHLYFRKKRGAENAAM